MIAGTYKSWTRQITRQEASGTRQEHFIFGYRLWLKRRLRKSEPVVNGRPCSCRSRCLGRPYDFQRSRFVAPHKIQNLRRPVSNYQ
jgi:hypothetical protein